MKKFITILLTLIVVIALCACTNSQSTQSEEPRVSDTNALYVCVGSNIIINGREISARSISTGYEYVMGRFFINRMTGEIIIYDNSTSTSMSISTGMYWKEKSVEINGEIIPMWFETTIE